MIDGVGQLQKQEKDPEDSETQLALFELQAEYRANWQAMRFGFPGSAVEDIRQPVANWQGNPQFWPKS